MNKCYFSGRTTRDIELRYTQANNTAIAKFGFAVDSGYGENKKTSFLNMTAWDKTAETLEKHVKKGTKLILECQAVQNQYTDKNGNKVSAVDFTVLNFEFAESKAHNNQSTTDAGASPYGAADADGFMNIPDGVADEGLPFN